MIDTQGKADVSLPDAVAAVEPSIGPPLPDDAVIILAVRNFVMFPEVVLPLTIGRPASVAAAQAAMRFQRPIGVLLQSETEKPEPGPDDLYKVGTIGSVLRYLSAPDGAQHLILQGEQRFRVTEFVSGWPFLVARVDRIEETEEKDIEIEARLLVTKQLALDALKLLPQVPQELSFTIENMTSAGVLADTIAAYLDISATQKQEILETVDLKERLDKLARLLAERLQVLRLSEEIGRDVQETLGGRQREALLREQMAAIQRQLGEEDQKSIELKELDEAITKAGMPAEVEERARKELRRLELMPEAATEYSMIRTYLDWLIELPWALPPEKPIDIARARTMLDEDHHDLDKVKRRIVEYLAVRKLAPEGKAPILCFAGPPGVGKTSLGQSIARAMDRKFARISLGGVHDESEIRGHRRTYVGALPGNIIQAIRKVGSRNCVLMLDEIDKLGRGMHGDPGAAMLEVLDPEQNHAFRDNYLGVPFDLSRVVFIATANMLETIPAPLRDRMEVISLPGYTNEEKLHIARRYLVPRQLAANGLDASRARIDDDALLEIIEHYTREAGVRNLERELGRALRHGAAEIAEGRSEVLHVKRGDLATILGAPRFENEVAQRTSVPGVATGLAWTPVGGDILFVEATRMPGSGQLILTGQLGDVMRESAQAAMSLVKSRAVGFGIDPGLFKKSDIHIHVPAGATPKDGPSAGVAMFTALFSLLTGRTIRSDTAMTGEISLRGLVLPVGGIKEKVIAAAGAGITRVMLPMRNKRDYEDIPQQAREKLEFIWLERVEDAIEAALEPAVAPVLRPSRAAGAPERSLAR